MARELPGGGVYIENLSQFRSDLRAAEAASPREMSKALKRAGGMLLSATKSYAPTITGLLVSGYKLSVRGTTGAITNRVPYAAGAEWGLHGKWTGFLRYPAAGDGRGRFAYRALVEKSDQLVSAIADEMREIVELHGWAR